MRFFLEVLPGAGVDSVRPLGPGSRVPLHDGFRVGRGSTSDLVIDSPDVVGRVANCVFRLGPARCVARHPQHIRPIAIDEAEVTRGDHPLRPGSVYSPTPGIAFSLVVEDAPHAILELTTIEAVEELLLFDPRPTSTGPTLWRAVPLVDPAADPIRVATTIDHTGGDEDGGSGRHRLISVVDDSGDLRGAMPDFAGVSLARLIALGADEGAIMSHDVIAAILGPIARHLAADAALRLHLMAENVAITFDGDVVLSGVMDGLRFVDDPLRARAPTDAGLVEIAALGRLALAMRGRSRPLAPPPQRWSTPSPAGRSAGPAHAVVARFLHELGVEGEVSDLVIATCEAAFHGARRITRTGLVDAFDGWLQAITLERADGQADLADLARRLDPAGAARERALREQLALIDEREARRLVALVQDRPGAGV